jgi:hypothetical protein
MTLAQNGVFSHHSDISATRPWPEFPSFPLPELRAGHSFTP